MAAIKGKNTKPELALRKALTSIGVRYRLNVKALPGKPDLVLGKYRAVLFVHGCFWHCHECSRFRWPKNDADWWHSKLCGNKLRDAAVQSQLLAMGWRVGTVWECAFVGRLRRPTQEIAEACLRWLSTKQEAFDIGEYRHRQGTITSDSIR